MAQGFRGPCRFHGLHAVRQLVSGGGGRFCCPRFFGRISGVLKTRTVSRSTGLGVGASRGRGAKEAAPPSSFPSVVKPDLSAAYAGNARCSGWPAWRARRYAAAPRALSRTRCNALRARIRARAFACARCGASDAGSRKVAGRGRRLNAKHCNRRAPGARGASAVAARRGACVAARGRSVQASGGRERPPPARATRRAPAPSSLRALRCTPHT